jgi:hypothetical protein
VLLALPSRITSDPSQVTVTLRKTVFDSLSERDLFQALRTTWSDRLNVFAQLPFSKILDFEHSSLTPGERDYLLKTNVDITVCTKEHRPLLSLEFDGIGHGFSRRGEYMQVVPTSDPYRKLKLDLKLRLAKEDQYPLFVISYDEKNPASPSTTLTIVDGIIGQVLAYYGFREAIGETVRQHEAEIAELAPDERDIVIQDLVTGVEVEEEIKWDPIAREAARLEGTAWTRNLCRSLTVEDLFDPPLPSGDPFRNPEIILQRGKAMKEARRVGCRVVVETKDGKVSQTVWLRNFEGFPIWPPLIAKNLARLLVFQRIVVQR